MSIQVFCPFLTSFFFLYISMNYLYILDINPLLVTQFANIFYHLVGGLFVLSLFSFAGTKAFKFYYASFAYISFVSFALGDRSKKNTMI